MIEAETFQEIFGSCKLKNLKDLNLEKHLIGETQKRCKQPALQLADIYINKNPTLDLETFVTHFPIKKMLINFSSLWIRLQDTNL